MSSSDRPIHFSAGANTSSSMDLGKIEGDGGGAREMRGKIEGDEREGRAVRQGIVAGQGATEARRRAVVGPGPLVAERVPPPRGRP